MVGLDKLGHGFLEQASPKLVLLRGLGKAKCAMFARPLPVWQAVVDCDDLPLFCERVVKANVISSIRCEFVLLEERPDAVGILSNGSKGGHQPAVSKVTWRKANSRTAWWFLSCLGTMPNVEGTHWYRRKRQTKPCLS